ncbi:MAG: sodium-dependent transporter [Methanobrevibacter sp.]|jgi:NSS family neurotransmitter:Na+ symporter|nr:sodium-dependent transporter [Candidatus Methanovirga meridionalis]
MDEIPDDDDRKMSNNTQWDSYLTFLLSMIGSAVGLGNIWRYPYIVYSNGGGTFIFVYVISIFLVAIPFMFLEYSIGVKFNSSVPQIFKSIKNKFEIVGWFIAIIPFLVLTYYACVIGWDIIYFALSFFKGWGTNTDHFFLQTVLQSTDSLTGLTYIAFPCLFAILIVWFIVWFISHKDINAGIGKVNKIMIPLIFLIMGIIVFYSLTLKGASFGLIKLFNPNFNEIYSTHIWIAAISQIFFSLSIGEGILITYASYLPKKTNLIKSSFIVTSVNCGFELFTAIGIFSILGFMSTTTGININDLVTQGTGLTFIVFPMILNIMGPVAYLIGPLFFLCIFFAGITSAISFFEPITKAMEEKFNVKRKKVVTYMCIVGALLTMIFTTGAGSYLLTIFDKILNEVGLFLITILESIIFSWFYGIDKLLIVLNKNSKLKIGRWWKVLIKYILPILLIFIWINEVINTFNTSSTKLIINFIITMIFILLPLMLTLIPSKSSQKISTLKKP